MKTLSLFLACLLVTTIARAADGAAAAAPPMALTATDAKTLGTLPVGVGVARGSHAPDATLEQVSGGTVKLSALYAKGPTLVVFYRGGWCPFCNLQLHELALKNAEFKAAGVNIVAVSVETPSEEAKTQAKHGIPFAVLSDPTLALHTGFKVLHKADEAEVSMLKGYGIDLEAASGQKHHTFAVPAVFLIDKAGIVRWGHAEQDYKTRPTTEQLLAAVRANVKP